MWSLEDDQFMVLINDEEQYSLWRKENAIPEGWKAAGCEGTKAACLAFVDENWKDMRPLSLRRAS